MQAIKRLCGDIVSLLLRCMQALLVIVTFYLCVWLSKIILGWVDPMIRDSQIHFFGLGWRYSS